jgi:putative ABC transport system permease protein
VETNGRQRTIIGVMGEGFDFPLRLTGTTRTPSQHMDFWTPEAIDPVKVGRTLGYCGLARLKPGVSIAQAQQDVKSIAADIARSFPATNAGRTIGIVSLRTETLGFAENGLWLLMGAALLFMLIGCANVANLILARSLARRREISIRMALGAPPRRIVRQLVTESCVLAMAGGLAGFVLTIIAWKLLPALAPVTIPRLADTKADAAVLGFAIAIAIVNGILFGLAPAARACMRAGAETLSDSNSRGSVGCPRNRLRSTLVIAEVAVAVTLVLAGGLITASFLRLLGTNPGFDRNVLASIIVPSRNDYNTPEKRALLFRRIVDAVRRVPGVQFAGTVDVLPFSSENNSGAVTSGDDPAPAARDQAMVAEFDHVSADYLPAMGVRLLDGRWFHDDDLAEGRDVAIINDALANKLWPGQSAVGKEICMNCYAERFRERRTVVGVVATTRHAGLDDPAGPQVYETAEAFRWADFLVVRTNRPMPDMTKAVRLAVASVDPKQPVFLSTTMAQLIDDSVADRRFIMILLAATGSLALLLAAAGIYGVISYTTSLRTAEIGVRMALGAAPRNVEALVFRGGMSLAGAGIAIGLAVTLALFRVLRGFFADVVANSPILIGSVIVLVLAIAALACWIPARRATRIDPISALREN